MPAYSKNTGVISEADITLAGSTGKTKIESRTKTQTPLGFIATLVVSLCGGGLYAYSSPVAAVGLWPAMITAAAAVALNISSIAMMGPVTGNFDLPFDAAFVDQLGPIAGKISNGAAVLLLTGVLMSVHIFNTGLWQRVVFSWFIKDEHTAWLAGFGSCFFFSILLSSSISDTRIIVKILSFSFCSVLMAVFALIYTAVTAIYYDGVTQCVIDSITHPFSFSEWRKGAGAGAVAMASLFGICASSLFVHNGLPSYMAGHPDPPKRTRHLGIAMGIAGSVYVVTGFAAVVPYACNPASTPEDASSIAEGVLGVVAQVFFLLQCTCVVPLYMAILRTGTVDRLPWEKTQSIRGLCVIAKEKRAKKKKMANAMAKAKESEDREKAASAKTSTSTPAAAADAYQARGCATPSVPGTPAIPAGELADADADAESNAVTNLSIQLMDRFTASAPAAAEGRTTDLAPADSAPGLLRLANSETCSVEPCTSESVSGNSCEKDVLVDDAEAVTDVDERMARALAQADLVAAGLDQEAVAPPLWARLALNLTITALCALVVLAKVQLTVVLKYAGAITGFVYVYTLPSLYWVMRMKRMPSERSVGRAVVCGFLFVAGVLQLVGVSLS